LHDPLAALLSYDLADVVPPNDDCADRWAAGVGAVSSPRSCEIELRTRITADLSSHVPSTPSRWTAGGCVMSMVMVAVGIGGRSEGGKHGDCRKQFTHYNVLLFVGTNPRRWGDAAKSAMSLRSDRLGPETQREAGTMARLSV